MSDEYDFSDEWEALSADEKAARLEALKDDKDRLQSYTFPERSQAEIEALEEDLGIA
ncbi:hypothetical protein [Halorhabdus sp. CUG00001]|uniref:hypothetical protein n=1 Tax=Halorhabdus sp. CUG00001 TaxID=2600297 RepID=UPI00131D326B|nr:hypothetical protein [Halorhabdus sp. CUG00001]